MTVYFKVTEKELIALKDAADSLYSMGAIGEDDDDLVTEGRKAVNAIDSILKRNGLRRVENEYNKE